MRRVPHPGTSARLVFQPDSGGLMVALNDVPIAGLATFREDAAGEWFVLHTLSRQEKKLAEELQQLQIQHYLPLVQTIRYYGKRRFHVREPLFPGYVFLRGAASDAYGATRTERIAKVLSVKGQVQLNWELQNLFIALSNGSRLDPFPFLKKGTLVEVKSGPLRGLQGLVESRINFDRLILQVEMLGRAMTMELHGALVDPLD
jgi:transcription antitermination factor NusG